MSITDELRHFANEWDWLDYKADDSARRLRAIADRIDMNHKHAIAYVSDYDPETMSEGGWVKLPIDADGVPIRIGDTLHDDCDYELDSLFEVEYMQLKKEGWSLVGNGGWCHNSKECHHHHKLTVEDVLEEYRVRNFDLVVDMECKKITNDEYVQGIDSLNAEYAAKLRLAEDGKEQQ